MMIMSFVLLIHQRKYTSSLRATDLESTILDLTAVTKIPKNQLSYLTTGEDLDPSYLGHIRTVIIKYERKVVLT